MCQSHRLWISWDAAAPARGDREAVWLERTHHDGVAMVPNAPCERGGPAFFTRFQFRNMREISKAVRINPARLFAARFVGTGYVAQH